MIWIENHFQRALFKFQGWKLTLLTRILTSAGCYVNFLNVEKYFRYIHFGDGFGLIQLILGQLFRNLITHRTLICVCTCSYVHKVTDFVFFEFTTSHNIHSNCVSYILWYTISFSFTSQFKKTNHFYSYGRLCWEHFKTKNSIYDRNDLSSTHCFARRLRCTYPISITWQAEILVTLTFFSHRNKLPKGIFPFPSNLR